MGTVSKFVFEDISNEKNSLLDSFEITTDDVEFVREHLKKVCDEHLDKTIDIFYQWMKEGPLFEQFFQDRSLEIEVQRLQKIYWREFSLMTSMIAILRVEGRSELPMLMWA